MLKNECYPMLKEAALFSAAYGNKGDDGRIHLIPSLLEECWGITPEFRRNKDAISALCMFRWTLTRAAEAADRQDAVVEALFCAYFQQGQDIGDETVLAGIAQANGVVFDDSHRAEVLAEDAAFRRAGLSGVPSFLMEGYFLFSGAMPSEAMEDQFLKAHAALINKLT
jgi:predicted DsbA family dithiol-disulfide isomerase